MPSRFAIICAPRRPSLAMLTVFAVFALVVGASGPARAANPAGIDQLIQARVESHLGDRKYTRRGELLCGLALIPQFYEIRSYRPAWTGIDGIDPQALAWPKVGVPVSRRPAPWIQGIIMTGTSWKISRR